LWSFEIATSDGPVSTIFSQPEAAKLLCCPFVRVKFRLGRLSHTPIDFSLAEGADFKVRQFPAIE
jgi:hypothetical protein